MRRFAAVLVAAGAALVLVSAASARVLLVGSYHGIPGQFRSIQVAVNAARPGDWILIGPGDYKTSSSRHPGGRRNEPAGVLVTTPNIWIRGMNRNTVVVDGTKQGSPTCSRRRSDQNFGPRGKKGPFGLNGIMVFKANNVWVQNLTVCNFLSGKGNTGNEIWWNGGDGTGRIGGHGYVGSYLNATNLFFRGNGTAAQYGIFSSNWTGGTWNNTYASNFSDSGYYIGACQQVCNQTINHAHAQFNAIGYSGSNSGGQLVIKNSEFDQNTDGFDTNSQNGDDPAPQNGACPHNGISPITHTHSCWVLMDSYLHDNNNPNAPGVGTAAAAAVGTGLSISGGRKDTVMDNRIVRNNAWGVLVQVFPDSGPPCDGGTLNFTILGISFGCLFDQWGNAILNNKFANNGSYGHATNGDIAAQNFEAGHPRSCYRGNTNPGGLTTSPASLEQTNPTCNGTIVPANPNVSLALEQLCSNEATVGGGTPSPCPGGHPYPTRTTVIMHPLPRNLKTMPNPCAGVPANPWCPGRQTTSPSSAPPSGLG